MYAWEICPDSTRSLTDKEELSDCRIEFFEVSTVPSAISQFAELKSPALR